MECAWRAGAAEEMPVVEVGERAAIGASQTSVQSPVDAEAAAISGLQSLPWEFIITRDARQEWAGLDRPQR